VRGDLEPLFLLAFSKEEFLAALAMASSEAFFNKLSIREILTRLRSLYETTWWDGFRFPGSALVWMILRIFSAPCEPACQN
jgi:hypothetical protein